MKELRILTGILLMAGIMMLQSCNEPIPEDETSVRVTFKSATSPSGLKSASIEGIQDIEITEAMVGIEKIKFKPLGEGRNDHQAKIVFKGPYVINLLTGNAEPPIDWTAILPGMYKEIEVETEDVLEGGNSIIIKGNITLSDLSVTPFEFMTDDDIEIEIEDDYGFTISLGLLNDLLVTFNLSDLFDKIDLSHVEVGEDGVLRFNDEMNEEITELLEEALDDIGKIKWKDNDHDDDDHDDKGHDDDDDHDDDHDDDDDDNNG
ncbi:hypothetical protein BA6E_106134 [Bacteroidales bacterium 6E]|nr:hypothetical protein BA6E_106134 [Bacteroidales bacterium 6E]